VIGHAALKGLRFALEGGLPEPVGSRNGMPFETGHDVSAEEL